MITREYARLVSSPVLISRGGLESLTEVRFAADSLLEDTQELAWRRSITVWEDGAAQPRMPEQRLDPGEVSASALGRSIKNTANPTIVQSDHSCGSPIIGRRSDGQDG